MDSILIYQAANDLVQNTGTRNIKRIARSCSLDILETPRFKDVLGFLSLHFDKPLILINSHLDSQTKQMVCGYALGHYLEHQILMDLHTLNKSLAITDKQSKPWIVQITRLPKSFGIQQKKAGPSAWICTTSYLPNALQSAAKKEELTAASPPDVKIGTKKFSKKAKK